MSNEHPFVTLRNTVMYGLISQLEDGQIPNFMAEIPIDQLVHLGNILREMHVETGEIRYEKLTEAVMQELHSLGITFADDL